ncbi:MAG: DMT family transporter [Candidatus Gracilibacteria bacterium]|jgi:drug/metabolite transporter (DMT)-like permease
MVKKSKLAYIYTVLAILLWGSTASVSKLILQDISSIQLIFYSFPFTIVGLFLIMLFQGKLKDLTTYKKQDIWKLAGMGFLGCFLYYVFLFGAIERTSAQEAFVVNYLWPVMVVIFGVLLLREKFTGRTVISILLSFIGVAIVVSKGEWMSLDNLNLTAILMAASGAMVYGLFSVLGKKLKYEVFSSMFYYYLFGFIYVLLSVLFFSEIPSLDMKQVAGLAWIGFFTNGLAFVFWFKALEIGETAKVSNLVFLTPFASLIFIHFLVGEPILISSIIGLVLIVLGVLIQSYKKS